MQRVVRAVGAGMGRGSVGGEQGRAIGVQAPERGRPRWEESPLNLTGAQLWSWASGVAAALGAALLLWALFADWLGRARKGRTKRCPKCWYEMEGIPAASTTDAAAGGVYICPECGGRVRGEKKLLRSRRRWGWAVVGVLLGVGATSQTATRVWKYGWTAGIPGWVLVRVIPVETIRTGEGDRHDFELFLEVNARQGWHGPELSDGQIRTLLRRAGASRVLRDPWPSDVDVWGVCHCPAALSGTLEPVPPDGEEWVRTPWSARKELTLERLPVRRSGSTRFVDFQFKGWRRGGSTRVGTYTIPVPPPAGPSPR